MWQQEQGIVLSSVRHNDKTCIVRIFTATHGFVPFVFHLAQSGKNSPRNALVQPLTQIEFQTDYKPSNTLMPIREIKNCSPYRSIPFNPVKSAVSLFLSEFLTYAMKGEGCNSRLLAYLQGSLKWFDEADLKDTANFHIAFMLGTASLLGICPDPSGYLPGYSLDLREGHFTSTPIHTDYADTLSSGIIANLLSSSFDKMKDAPLNGQLRVSVLKTLNRWFILHMPSFPVLESIGILETVFS